MKADFKELKPDSLPQDLSLCHEIIRLLLRAKADSDALLDRLRHQLERMIKARYGSKADRIDPNQLLLFALDQMSLPPEQVAEIKEKMSPAKGASAVVGHGRRVLPKTLPRVRQEQDLTEEEKLCSVCLSPKVKIGEEISEQLDYRPAALYVIEQVRPVYACPNECQGAVYTAPAPERPIAKGLPGPGLLAQVVVGKYADHLPLYRLEGIFERHGLDIPRSTQWGWVRESAEMLKPLYRLMIERVKTSKVIQTDDTPVKVQDRERDKTRTGRMWVYLGDASNPYVVYDFTPDRKRDGPRDFLKNFKGYLQADAYGGYDGIYASGKVKEVACWAHARRYFVEAQSSDTQGAATAVAWIKKLYEVEDEVKNLASPARSAHRQAVAKPLLDQFKAWLEQKRRSCLPKSPMGGAIAYTLSNFVALGRYLEDGDLCIDNNASERALRGIAVGRKNWLFAGSDLGGRTAAVLYSFVTTCKRHGFDPFEYLRDVLTRINGHPMKRLAELLPDQWKDRHPDKFAAPAPSIP